MLRVAVLVAVDDSIAPHDALADHDACRLVVRNGHLSEMRLLSPIGARSLGLAHVRRRRRVRQVRSAILQTNLFRAASIDAVVTPLRLKETATTEHPEATASSLWRGAAGLSEEDMRRLRLHTRTGRPLGSTEFVGRLENALGRRLTPLRPGRKPPQPGGLSLK